VLYASRQTDQGECGSAAELHTSAKPTTTKEIPVNAKSEKKHVERGAVVDATAEEGSSIWTSDAGRVSACSAIPQAGGEIVRRGRFVFIVAVLVAALGVFASVAAADPPATATGTFTATGPPTVTDVRTVGGNTFLTESVPVVYAGDLSGPFVVQGTFRIKPDGSVAGLGSVVCTGCTIGGRTGDFTAATYLSGPSSSDVTGIIIVLSASGGLAGLHAYANYAGGSVSGTYTYRYHFEP
jgi:hypothetical protein